MHMRIMLAVAHCTDFIVNGIGVVMIFQVSLYKSFDDLFMLFQPQLVRQRKFYFPVSCPVGTLVQIGSFKKCLGGAVRPFRQMMRRVKAATLRGIVFPTIDIICMRCRQYASFALLQDLFRGILYFFFDSTRNIPSHNCTSVGSLLLQAGCIVTRQ